MQSNKPIDRLLWWYWKINKGFLRAFAETLIGQGKAELKPEGKAILAHLENFLKQVPRPVFVQFMLALLLLPVAVPRVLPRSGFWRFLVKAWSIIKSHFARYAFRLRPQPARAQYVDQIFKRLAEQAAEQEDDLVKSIIVLTNIKSALSAAYMELDSTWKAMGYSPYPPGNHVPPSGPNLENPPRTKVSELLHARSIKNPREIAGSAGKGKTYCIIGSGAGGAVAAYSIQELDKEARVIILEAGPLVTNEQFPVRALEATARLFMNAGATLTQDQKFTFRQGRCVGGSTTVNNAIAIKPEGFWWEENIVARWKSVGADLKWDELNRAYEEIAPLINVHTLDERTMTIAAKTMRQGFQKLGLDGAVKTVPANLQDCIGCGRCNLGCQYDAKRSMLNALIPTVVERGGYLVPAAKVSEIKFDRQGSSFRATHAVIETEAGDRVEIAADKFILAAGAYASSKLLWKSGFTGACPGVRTVGKRFTCNFGSPLIGRFREPQRGWAGQQIGYVVEMPKERIIIETAFAPPSVLGFLAPHWGNDFMKVVEAFDYLAVTAPTVSSLSYGQVKKGLLGESGFVIDYAMIDEDWRRLAAGMKLSAQAMFAMGAEEIYTTRFDAKTLKRGENIDRYFAGIGPVDYFKVETGHPQGGNVIHDDPHQGVVDAGLKVHGAENLWICDASVIPASITLNLQFTIMALARYAASRIVAFHA